MIGKLKLALVFSSGGLVLLIFLPIQVLALVLAPATNSWFARRIPVYFHRILLILFGVRMKVEGELPKDRPLLIVANHISWLDIVVLGSVAPLSFIAKYEMASWPLFGLLAKLQRTVFVKREERRKSGDQANEIAERMTAQEVMVLFPEATTSDANALLPFKTTLFEAAKMALAKSPVETAIVQPVAVSYTHLHGLPIGRACRPHVAWPGEIGLGENLLPLVKTGALDVVLRIGEPVILTDDTHRKEISAKARDSIRSMLSP